MTTPNNSFEQELALKNWVDMAIKQLNQGMGEQDVHDYLEQKRCPDPDHVLMLAMAQPEQGLSG
jgi:hypothetical protein